MKTSKLIAFFAALSFFLGPIPKKTEKIEKQKIPVLLYHHISYGKGRLYVTPENFRKQLQKLYDADFVTIKFEDLIENRIKVKEGKRPVVLTFDDGTSDQFRYINGKIDQKCAFAIINDFYSFHPDFGRNAIFFVCPGTRMVFWQKGLEKKKLEAILDAGMEIGNHTYTHEYFVNASPKFVDYQLGAAMQQFEKWLGKKAEKIKIVALPFGYENIPRNPATRERFKEFEWKGKKYKNIGMRMAYGKYNKLCPHPSSPEFNRWEIPSLEVTNTNIDEIIKMAK